MATTIIDDTFVGAAGNLTGHTGPLGENWSLIDGTISLSGSGTVYDNAASGTTSRYYVDNKFASSMDQTISATLKYLTSPSTEVVGPYGWADATLQAGYVLLYTVSAASYTLFVSASGGSFSPVTGATNLSITLADGDILGLRLSTAQQQILKNGSVVNTTTDTTYTPTNPAAVYSGIWMDGLVVTALTGLHFDEFKVVDNASALSLVAPAPQITAQTTTSVTLSETPTGGTPSYSYQWYKDTTPNFTAGPGNAIGGATSSTVTISVTSTRQYVRCKVTDSAAVQATSYQRTIEAAKGDVVTIIQIGDSTSLTPSVPLSSPVFTALQVRTLGGFQNVINTNVAVAGSATADWNTGGANMNAFDAAVAACSTRFIVSLTLGVNDAQGSVVAATYDSNMASIIAHVLAQTNSLGDPPLVVFVDYPTWREPGYYNVPAGTFSEAYSTFIWAYATAINGLVNGTTIRSGNTKSLDLWAQYPTVYMDLDGGVGQVGFIHPNQAGSQNMGFEKAKAILEYFYPIAGSSPVAY